MTRRSAMLVVGLISAVSAIAAIAPSCSLGQGVGSVSGALDVPTCWSGCFNLRPDFFSAVPYRDTLDIRIQNGSGYETYSDGVEILVDNIHLIRADDGPGMLGMPLPVSLPVGVTPPGFPVVPMANPALVHMTVYLQNTCQTQNVALYATDVTLNADGSCGGSTCGGNTVTDAMASSDASYASLCGSSSADAGASPAFMVGHSTVTFAHLFDGNEAETNATQRLTEGDFDVYLADPREGCSGGLGPPPPCRGHLTGNFSFYFEQGRPAQPFP